MFQFRRFPSYTYLIQCRMTEYCSAGFPHSEILGSKLMCSSPRLIAACHVLHRLLMPRHSPCALISLTSSERIAYRSLPPCGESSLTSSLLLFLTNPLPLGFVRMRVDSIYFGSHLELCRLQFGYIVVLLPLIVILKVHKSLYFVTSLLLARNFLLASLFSFQGASFLISFKIRLKHFTFAKCFNLTLVEIIGIEPMTPCLQGRCSPS